MIVSYNFLFFQIPSGAVRFAQAVRSGFAPATPLVFSTKRVKGSLDVGQSGFGRGLSSTKYFRKMNMFFCLAFAAFRVWKGRALNVDGTPCMNQAVRRTVHWIDRSILAKPGA